MALRRSHASQARDVHTLIPTLDWQCTQTGTVDRVPQPDGPVLAATGQQQSVRAEGYAHDHARMPLQGSPRPPAESGTHHTPPVCPCNVVSSCPLGASHSRMVVSWLPLTSSRPSVDRVTLKT